MSTVEDESVLHLTIWLVGNPQLPTKGWDELWLELHGLLPVRGEKVIISSEPSASVHREADLHERVTQDDVIDVIVCLEFNLLW